MFVDCFHNGAFLIDVNVLLIDCDRLVVPSFIVPNSTFRSFQCLLYKMFVDSFHDFIFK